MRRGLRAALLGVLALTLVAPPGVAAGSPVGPDDPTTPAIPRRYLDQKITWSTCEFDAAVKSAHPQAPTTNCATVKVPMDWKNPDDHPDITVAIAHSKATGTSKGLLATNPGGPAAGMDLSAFLGAAKPRLFADFDLLGFDPRGFGKSDQVKCPTTEERLNSIPFTPDHRERTQRTVDAEIAWSNILSDACAGVELARFVSTQQIVYDLEFLRTLFKAPKLNYIGYSYGTLLGSWYADTYPSRVGRFVLDSNMGFGNGWQVQYAGVPKSGQRRFDTQFVPWLVRQADQVQGLGSTAAEIKAEYESIRAKLVDLVKAGNSYVRGDDMDRLIFWDLYGNRWMVKAAVDILVHDEYTKAPSTSGDVEPGHVDRAYARLGAKLRPYVSIDEVRETYGLVPGQASTAVVTRAKQRTARPEVRPAGTAAADEPVDLDAGFDAVVCNDTRWSTNIARYRREAERDTAKYPLQGYLSGVSPCAFWKFPAQDRVIDFRGAPGVLMVQAELDVITHYEGALQAHRDTRRSTRLLSVDDEGQHGQYILGPSSCAEEIGDRYVFDGVLPVRDVVCGTSPLPGDSEVHHVRGPVDARTVHESNRGNAASARVDVADRLLEAAAILP